MKGVLVLCEGQTEQTFVSRVLAPHLQRLEKNAIPKVLVTKKSVSGKEFQGGITSYEKIRKDLQHLLRDTHVDCVTTLLDYYGLPKDFPGKDTQVGRSPYERVACLEQAFYEDIQNPRFLPYLMLHEFEALLFVDLKVVGRVLSPDAPVVLTDWNPLCCPEEINEGEQTHPSARIQKKFAGYRKALHGPLIVQQIGLERIREKCPHFDSWLKKLEAL